jgi:hypothetical protein
MNVGTTTASATIHGFTARLPAFTPDAGTASEAALMVGAL